MAQGCPSLKVIQTAAVATKRSNLVVGVLGAAVRMRRTSRIASMGTVLACSFLDVAKPLHDKVLHRVRYLMAEMLRPFSYDFGHLTTRS